MIFPPLDLMTGEKRIIVIRLCSLISRPAARERGTQFDCFCRLTVAEMPSRGAQIRRCESGHFQALARQLTSSAGLGCVARADLKGHFRSPE